MKAILPILASLPWLWLSPFTAAQAVPGPPAQPLHARAAAPPTGTENIPGDSLLSHVAGVLANHPSIAAKVRQRVDLLGHALMGSGIYLQQGRGAERLMRLDLTLQTLGGPNVLQQIDDGNRLWLYRQVGDRKDLAQVDLVRLSRAKSKSPPGPSAETLLALGGLPKLMTALLDSFHFGMATRSQLDKLAVWNVEGQWKPETLARLLPDQKGAIESGGSAQLKPNMPDRVVIFVGCDDYFPYRFEYWRQDPNRVATSANDRGRLLVVMELYEVRLDGPVDPRHFVLQARDVQPVDKTTEYLQRFGLEEVLPAGASRSRSPRR
jgi:hypothetical protein